MVYAIAIVCSFIFSFVIHAIIHYRVASGTLRIDHSNPEKDIYRFEIDDIDKLSTKKRIMLKVDNNADLSQK